MFVRFSKGAGLITSDGCGRSAVKGMTDDNGDSSSFSMTASALRGPRSGDGRREMNGPIERKLTGMSHSAQTQMQTCTHAETSSCTKSSLKPPRYTILHAEVCWVSSAPHFKCEGNSHIDDILRTQMTAVSRHLKSFEETPAEFCQITPPLPHCPDPSE